MENFELILSDKNYFIVECLSKKVPTELKGIDLRKIPWNQSLEVLKKLAALGMVSFEGKNLILDLFSKVSVVLEVRANEHEDMVLNAYLKLKELIPLSKCRFIAPSFTPWFVFDRQLKVISSAISGMKLLSLPKVIDQKELKELQEDSDIEVKIDIKIKQVEPLPVLRLTERSGAFANMYMDYGKGKCYLYPPPHDEKNERLSSLEKHWEKDLLETGYALKIVEKTRYYCPLDKVGKSLAFLLEMGWKIFDVKNNPVLLETKRDISTLETKNHLQLKGEVTFDKFSCDVNQMAGAFNRRERFVDLGNGMSGLLQDQDPLQTLVEEGEWIGENLSLPRSHIALLEPLNPTWEASPDLKSFLSGKSLSTNPSVDFQGNLRPYQSVGLNWIKTLYQAHLHGILGDEMGLGKTVQAIAFLSTLDNLSRHLIIVPTSLLFNWQREIEHFLPTMPCFRYHGDNRNHELPNQGVIITSYHTLRSDQDFLCDIPWDCIILDEAQAVKNPDSQVAQALYRLKSRFRLLMSGTLIENHARELWAHFNFLMPGMLGERDYFEQHLSLSEVDSRYVRKIQKMISPFILRRKKEEVAKDLPPLEDQMVYLEMTSEQRNVYESYLSQAKKGILNKIDFEGSKKKRIEIFEVLLRLRQIVCHPMLVSQLVEEETSSGKFEALLLDMETIREEGKKAIIFSQFASMLHLIAKELKKENVPFCLLEGATLNREEEVKRFQEDKTVPFFLMTLKAGGVGLNLTSADYVLLYEPWWHEAAEAQAIARAHRIGQTKPVFVRRYITLESVEEKMVTLKKSKSALFSHLTEGEIGEGSLEFEDLAFLLE